MGYTLRILRKSAWCEFVIYSIFYVLLYTLSLSLSFFTA